MKKSLLFAISFLVLPPLTSCGTYDLVVFNWGEYADMDVIRRFEKKYNAKVNYLTFDSNENLLSKLETTHFDIAFPSEYAIEELMIKDKIKPIDYTKLQNIDVENDLVPSFKAALDKLKQDKLGKEGFDLLKYAIPYTWGVIGMLYNKDVISEEELKIDGWDALIKKNNRDGSERRVVMYDSARDVFSVALLASGLDFVEVEETGIDTAKEWLIKQKKSIGNNLAYKTEEILDDMPSHKYDICFSYIGDALYTMLVDYEENEQNNFGFYIPEAKGESRTNIYVDAICLSKNVKNEDLAYKFIDFMQDYENAYDNALYNGYPNPIEKINHDITSDSSEYEDGEPGSYNFVSDIYRFDANDKDVFYRYDEELKRRLEEAWIEVKIS